MVAIGHRKYIKKNLAYISILFLILSVSCNSVQKRQKCPEMNDVNTQISKDRNGESTYIDGIQVDTLFIDNYYWQFHVTEANHLYFLKANNVLYEYANREEKMLIQIASDKYFRKFHIFKNFLIAEFGDVGDAYIDIYDLGTGKLVFFLSDNVIIGGNKNFYTIYIDEFYNSTIVERNIENHSVIDSFEMKPDFIFESDKVLMYELDLSLKNKTGEILLEELDLKNKKMRNRALVLNNEDYLVYVFDGYYIAIDGKKIYIAENSNGKILKEWDLFVDKFFQGLIYQNKLYLYDWLNEVEWDEVEGKEFAFVRQVIDLPDFLSKELKDLNVLIKDPTP